MDLLEFILTENLGSVSETKTRPFFGLYVLRANLYLNLENPSGVAPDKTRTATVDTLIREMRQQMRLSWSFHQLTNSDFSRPFQRYQIIKASSSCPHPVLIEASNFVHGSNIYWCGRSYAASASSDALEAKKIRRRVSQDERKSMVENYVNRYREMNAGKFPTTSDVRKNVGGSHYNIRRILQELMYYSERPVTETKDFVPPEKSAVNMDEICTNSGEGLQGEGLQRNKQESIGPISNVDMRDVSSKSFISKEGLQSPILYETDVSTHDEPQSQRLVREPKSSLQSGPEKNKKHKTAHEDKQNWDGLQHKTELEQSTESDASGRESYKVTTEDAEPSKKSSVWQNLRSFANGILGILKRS